MIVARVPLTSRQQEVYNFIRTRVLEAGVPPTVREIANQFKIQSPYGVVRHLHALEKKGVIYREEGRARGIRLSDQAREAGSMPLAGRVSAGILLDAIEWPERITFATLFGEPDQLRAVIVDDGSLLAEGYRQGDCLLRNEEGRTIGMIRRLVA